MRITDLRTLIDETDDELIALLERRARLALRVGALKRVAGLPLYDPEREADIIARARRANAKTLDPEAITRIFRRIIRETRRAEECAVKILADKVLTDKIRTNEIHTNEVLTSGALTNERVVVTTPAEVFDADGAVS